MESIGTWWLWLFFFIFIGVIILIDGLILRYKKKPISVRSAAIWTLIWVASALFFNILLWIYLASSFGQSLANEKALEFFTGYLIEEMLSVDNMFAFLLIFNYFSVPSILQRRVLLYGVAGAIVMRLVMILFGTWLILKFHWILYVFGLFLLITGIKMLFASKFEKPLEENRMLKWVQKHIRVTAQFEKEKFFIKKEHLWYATPLFLTLLMIEGTDLVFALDSIPAVFAITNDPFIVFTSNIFAILGLRALYFLLRDAAKRFHLLKYGVALILSFIGAKMLMAAWITIPVQLALGVVVAILGTTIVLSVLNNRYNKHKSRKK